LILGESSAARWIFDGGGLSDKKFAIVMTRSKKVAESLKLETFWTPLEADWFVSRAYPAHVYPYPACLKKFLHS
jgi:hypothetical protein